MTSFPHFEGHRAPVFKALAFGTAASTLLALGIAQANDSVATTAQPVQLAPVVIHVKRERLPTVYIHGRSDPAATDAQMAGL